jgi:hypothetical protein
MFPFVSLSREVTHEQREESLSTSVARVSQFMDDASAHCTSFKINIAGFDGLYTALVNFEREMQSVLASMPPA